MNPVAKLKKQRLRQRSFPVNLFCGAEKIEKRFGVKDDGWDKEDFENIDLMHFFRDLDILSYEINNCFRGS